MLVLWRAKNPAKKQKAEYHQGIIDEVLLPVGYTDETRTSKRRQRQKFKYKIREYRDGNPGGTEEYEWLSECICHWPWEDGGDSTDEEMVRGETSANFDKWRTFPPKI